MPRRRKETKSFSRMISRLHRMSTGLKEREKDKLAVKIVALRALASEPFYQRLSKEKRRILRNLVIEHGTEQMEAQYNAPELFERLSKGEIDEKKYWELLWKHPASFRLHVTMELLEEFLENNGISEKVFFEFMHKMEIMLRETV